MLSFTVDTQAKIPSHVYSDWGLGSSLDSFIVAEDARLSLRNTSIQTSPNNNTNNQHNNTITFAVTSTQMAAYSPIEDKMYINESENLFAIFDGHGGDICSRYVVEKIPQQLLNTLKTKKHQADTEYINTFKSTYTKVDTDFLNQHKSIVKSSASGSCGLSVLVRNDTLYICNLGDSRVLIGSGTSHEQLTNDHNTKNEKERQLVIQRTTDPMPIRGHAINKVPGERIGGVLMVTRAFGDGIFKRRDMSLAPFIPHLPYITNEPEVHVRKLAPTDKYAIISSDGLYEYFSSADVAAIVEEQLKTTQDGTKIAAALIERQFEHVAKLAGKTVEQIKAIPSRKEIMDDVTIIVLIFTHPSTNTHPHVIGVAAK